MEHKYISQAKSLYPNKYDYSLLPETFKKKDKLKFKCLAHNEIFEQSFDTLLRGDSSSCSKCKEERKLLRLKTDSESNLKNFIEQATLAHNNSCDYSKVVYVNQMTKVLITCKIHNEQYEQLPVNHIKGITGCKSCITNINKGLSYLNTIAKQKFKDKVYNEGLEDKLNTIHKNKYKYLIPTDKHLKQDDNLLYVCKEHGQIEQKLLSHLQGHGCKYCGQFKKKIKTDFFELVKDNVTLDYSNFNYVNRQTKGLVKCKTCTHEWYVKPSHHLSYNTGCPVCSNDDKGFNKTAFKNRCKDNLGYIYLLKCSNNEEVFYKIGITSREIHKRFNSKNFIENKYKYNVISYIELESGIAYDLENKIKKYIKENNLIYTPKIFFKGHTECFKKEGLQDVLNILTDVA